MGQVRPVAPAVLLLCLCGIPEVIEAVGRKLGQINVGVGRHLLHCGPAAAELCRALRKSGIVQQNKLRDVFARFIVAVQRAQMLK